MRIALTGTPGTGKTTVANALDIPYEVVHLSAVIERHDSIEDHDPVRDTAIVDMDALAAAVDDLDDVVFESHLAHRLAVDRVIVLRCDPTELTTRLRQKGVNERSINENAQSEALDVILSEAVATHGRDVVYEIDTTDRSIDSVVRAVTDAITGKREPQVGIVDFTDYL